MAFGVGLATEKIVHKASVLVGVTTDNAELNANIGLTGTNKLGSGAKTDVEVRANTKGPSGDVTAVGIVLPVKVTLGNEQAADMLMDIDVMAGNEEIGGDETDDNVESYNDSGSNSRELLGNVPVDGVGIAVEMIGTDEPIVDTTTVGVQ